MPRICVVMVLLWATGVSGAPGGSNPLMEYLENFAEGPAEYVVSKLRDYRVVFLGEHHWIRHDVELVLSLIPRLQEANVHLLAIEMLRAHEQSTVDRLVNGREWDAEAAMRLQRAEGWPYREYLEIVRAVWEVNRSRSCGGKPLRLLALGPGADWRARLLPLGKTYDTFMAERLLEHLPDGGRTLVYGGLHHMFTRYYQPELPRSKRVEAFMDRMGNIVWRNLGEDAFTIVLHRPWRCRRADTWFACLPLSGVIDCAAGSLGRSVGFDVVGSPFAEIRLGSEALYALGYPDARLVDFTDGYIWTRPVEDYKGVTLIPLADFAPDTESLKEVLRNNPFSDEQEPTRKQLEGLWAQEAESLEDLSERFGWSALSGWRERCDQPR